MKKHILKFKMYIYTYLIPFGLYFEYSFQPPDKLSRFKNLINYIYLYPFYKYKWYAWASIYHSNKVIFIIFHYWWIFEKRKSTYKSIFIKWLLSFIKSIALLDVKKYWSGNLIIQSTHNFCLSEHKLNILSINTNSQVIWYT